MDVGVKNEMDIIRICFASYREYFYAFNSWFSVHFHLCR